MQLVPRNDVQHGIRIVLALMQEPHIRERWQILKHKARHAHLGQIIRHRYARRILALLLHDTLDGTMLPNKLERAVRPDVLDPLRKVRAEQERKVDIARTVEREGRPDGVAVHDDDGGFPRGDAAQQGGFVDEHVRVLADDVICVAVHDEGTRERFCFKGSRGVDTRDAHGTREFFAFVVGLCCGGVAPTMVGLGDGGAVLSEGHERGLGFERRDVRRRYGEAAPNAAFVERHLQLLLGHGIFNPCVEVIRAVFWRSVIMFPLWDFRPFIGRRHGRELSDALTVFAIQRGELRFKRVDEIGRRGCGLDRGVPVDEWKRRGNLIASDMNEITRAGCVVWGCVSGITQMCRRWYVMWFGSRCRG